MAIPTGWRVSVIITVSLSCWLCYLSYQNFINTRQGLCYTHQCDGVYATISFYDKDFEGVVDEDKTFIKRQYHIDGINLCMTHLHTPYNEHTPYWCVYNIADETIGKHKSVGSMEMMFVMVVLFIMNAMFIYILTTHYELQRRAVRI